MLVIDGFRQRGEQMTRLETFIDAAFPFLVWNYFPAVIDLLNRHALARAA